MTEHQWPDETGPQLPDPRMIKVRQVVRHQPTPTTVPLDATDEALETEDAIVRPFIVTGGRTQPTGERLRVETLVTAVTAAVTASLSFEHRHIVEICQRPLSVAEVASNLRVPIGVARVLIADLIAEQFVTVHEHLDLSDCSSRSLLERIREGVCAL